MAKKSKTQEQSDEMALVPSPETDIETVEEMPEAPQEEQKPRQSVGQVLRNIVLAILRLIIIVAVIGGCGAAVYYGTPLIYDQYVRRVDENASELSNLNFRQGQSEIQISELQTRLATLEAAQTPQSDSITDLNSRLQTLEGADAERNESLSELSYQSDLIRAMELLSRARLFLYQSNFGLARADVQVARDVLADMQPAAPADKQTDLTEAIFRLDLALKNLPDFPVAASDDLDIAWQVLMQGYPVAPTSTPTSTQVEAATATNTLETATAAPEITATPTAVP